jgi:hypothetical protein
VPVRSINVRRRQIGKQSGKVGNGKTRGTLCLEECGTAYNTRHFKTLMHLKIHKYAKIFK